MSQGIRKYASWHSTEAKVFNVGAFVGGEVGGSVLIIGIKKKIGKVKIINNK